MYSCQGITKSGYQCKRTMNDKYTYCWQHRRIYNRDDYDDNCCATTRAGSLCSRRAQYGKYCWQHDRMYNKSTDKDVQTLHENNTTLKAELLKLNKTNILLKKQNEMLISQFTKLIKKKNLTTEDISKYVSSKS